MIVNLQSDAKKEFKGSTAPSTPHACIASKPVTTAKGSCHETLAGRYTSTTAKEKKNHLKNIPRGWSNKKKIVEIGRQYQLISQSFSYLGEGLISLQYF